MFKRFLRQRIWCCYWRADTKEFQNLLGIRFRTISNCVVPVKPCKYLCFFHFLVLNQVSITFLSQRYLHSSLTWLYWESSHVLKGSAAILHLNSKSFKISPATMFNSRIMLTPGLTLPGFSWICKPPGSSVLKGRPRRPINWRLGSRRWPTYPRLRLYPLGVEVGHRLGVDVFEKAATRLIGHKARLISD